MASGLDLHCLPISQERTLALYGLATFKTCSGVRGLTFGLCLHLLPYFGYARSRLVSTRRVPGAVYRVRTLEWVWVYPLCIGSGVKPCDRKWF